MRILVQRRKTKETDTITKHFWETTDFLQMIPDTGKKNMTFLTQVEFCGCQISGGGSLSVSQRQIIFQLFKVTMSRFD